MMRFIPLAFALAAAPASAGPTLTCETQGDIRHCWDDRGNTVIAAERSGDYVHGRDNRGCGPRLGLAIILARSSRVDYMQPQDRLLGRGKLGAIVFRWDRCP